MLSGHGCGRAAGIRVKQGTQSRKGSQDVFARERIGQILAGRLEHEFDFFFRGFRIEGNIFFFLVRGSDFKHAVPRNAEQNPAVGSFRNKHAGLAAEMIRTHNNMRASGSADKRLHIRRNHTADFIGPDTGRIKDHAGLNAVFFAAEFILDFHNGNFAAAASFKSDDRHIVQQKCSAGFRRFH